MTASHTYKDNIENALEEEGQPSSNLELIHFISKGDCQFPVRGFLCQPGLVQVQLGYVPLQGGKGWIIGVQHKEMEEIYN